MAPPPALTGWMRSVYPSLVVNPEWIDGCVDYLTSQTAGLSGPSLIKQVEAQLLASDLSSSTLPPPAPLDPTSAIQFPTKTLLQLTSLDLVSHPALGLYETLKEKREARKAGVGGVGAAKKEEPGEEGAGAGEAEEGGRRGGAGEDGPEEDPVGVWPKKGLGRLEVSDGHSVWTAMEYRPLGEWCGLERVTLGAKMMVHRVRQVNGVLLLEPSCVTFKGGDVQELDQLAEWTLENKLRARLKMDPVPLPGTEPAPAAATPAPERKPSIKPDPSSKPKPKPTTIASRVITLASSGEEDDSIDIDPIDLDFDEEAMAEVEALEQQAIMARTANRDQPKTTSSYFGCGAATGGEKKSKGPGTGRGTSNVVGSLQLSPPGKKVLAKPLAVAGARAAAGAGGRPASSASSATLRRGEIEMIDLSDSEEDVKPTAVKRRKG